jgi:hypothetical protein
MWYVPGSYAVARIALGPGAGPIGGGDVERCADDRDVRAPAVQLLRLGQEGSMAERGQSRVGQIKLSGHAGGQITLG